MMTSRSIQFGLVPILLVALLTSAAAADKKKSKGGQDPAVKKVLNQVDARIAAARSAAAKAKSFLDRIKAQAASLGDETNRFKAEIEAAEASVASIERETAENAPSDSPFGQARERYEQARSNLQAATDRVLNSPAFVAEQKAAGDPQVAAELRSQALQSDPRVIVAQGNVREARQDYERELRKLLDSNESHDRATAGLSQARFKYEQTKSSLVKVLAERAAVTDDLNRAERALAELTAAKARAQLAAKLAEQAAKNKGKHKKKGKKRRR